MSEDAMAWRKIEAHWNRIKGTAKSRWSALTHDDLKRIDGKYDKLIGTLQARTGKARKI